MIPMQTIQFLAKQHPRVWRKATILQRKEIANRYVESGNVEYAFKNVRAYRVTVSDLNFDTVGSAKLGGGR